MTLDVFWFTKQKESYLINFTNWREKSKQHIEIFPHQGGGRLEWQKISPTLQSVLRTFTRFGWTSKAFKQYNQTYTFSTLPRVTSYMMSCANDTTRLLVASDISTFMFEMGRADWSSVRTQAIKLYNKFGMVTDCSFIKLPVGPIAMELTTWLLTKAISG
jgi:hypothetical protein